MKRTSSSTLPTLTSPSMATSRWFLCFCQLLVQLNSFEPIWSRFKARSNQKLVKMGIHHSTFFLFLAILFWREVELKKIEKCYRWELFILDPKKSKKARKCDKILLYYWVHSYKFDFLKGNQCEQMDPLRTTRACLSYWVWTCMFHSSSFVKYCANVFVQIINYAKNIDNSNRSSAPKQFFHPAQYQRHTMAIEGLKLQINLNANPPDKDGGELYKNCYHGGNISASSVERKQSCDDSDKRKVIKWNGEINLIIRSANAMMTHILLSCYNIGHIRAKHKVFSLGLFCILGGNMKYKK